MKNKFKYILIAMLVGLLACSDEFTTSTPIGSLDDAAIQNELGVNLMLTGAYSALDLGSIGGFRGSSDNWWIDAVSDDAHKGSSDGDQGELLQLELFDWTASNSYIKAQWQGLYAGVNRANAVLSLINGIEGGTTEFASQLTEARFLRAHFNFELTKIYGKVPYISEQNYADLEFSQPNEVFIWDKIEADLEAAVAALPTTQAERGRPTSWTAKAYLAKAYLFQEKWAAAANGFEDIINNGPYALEANHGDNFRLAGESGLETIFAVQFLADAAGSNRNGNQAATLNFPHGGSAPYSSCCGFFQPTQDLVNAFQTDGSGLPIFDRSALTLADDFKNTYDVADADPFVLDTRPIDPRLDFVAGRRGMDLQGYGENPGKEWVRATKADWAGSYLARKHVWHKSEEGDNRPASGRNSGVNFHFMRYADVLLMAAEALAESGGSLSTAMGYVNEVRNRAKTGEDQVTREGIGSATYEVEPYLTFTDPADALEKIYMERRLEFAMEGKRFADLTRWGTGEDVMTTYFEREKRSLFEAGVSTGSLDNDYTLTRHRYFPVPTDAIDLSGGIIGQNTVTGY